MEPMEKYLLLCAFTGIIIGWYSNKAGLSFFQMVILSTVAGTLISLIVL